MQKLNKFEIAILVIILLLNLAATIYIQKILFPIHYTSDNFFILDLLGRSLDLPQFFLYFFQVTNILILWLIGKSLFKGYYSLLPVLIYSISPWSIYLLSAKSFYIYLLSLILTTLYGLILVNKRIERLGTVLIIISCTLALLSKVVLVILPAIIILSPVFGLIEFKKLKLAIYSISILIIVVSLLSIKYKVGFQSNLNKDLGQFTDPGLINNVNRYQGAARENGLSYLAKFSQNKYIFTVEYNFLKYTSQLVPSTFFTPKEKLLNFSFEPPIFVGFLIPFLYGLYKLLENKVAKRALLLSTLLVFPSILDTKFIDLNKLLLFMPIVIIIISYGIIKLLKNRQIKTYKYLLIAIVCLLLFQTLFTISDINLKEQKRFLRYNGNNFNIGSQ